MSRTRSLVLLLAVGLLAALVPAGAASAKALTAKDRAAVRKQLRKQIKRNPRAIRSKRFLKRAALVNFRLPITIRLRGGNTPGTCNGFATSTCQPTPGVVPGSTNPNAATVDLGASLGSRSVSLGGSLAGEIRFSDSYDGGALGNVDLSLLPSNTKALSSTSIPLLWNDTITQPGTRWDSTLLFLDDPGNVPNIPSGCGDWTGTNLPFAANILPSGSYLGIPQPGGFPQGFPVADTPGGAPNGSVAINPGLDDVGLPNVGPRAGTQPGDNDVVGPNPNPFPSGIQKPGGFYAGPPTAKDTVLRTNALSLRVANAGTVVDQTDASPNGALGSQNIVIGKSGGQANLFGNIPGKPYGIDITVSLATQINSIFRSVDVDSFRTGLYHGQPWPGDYFNCRQAWTGYVDNYIPGVRLKGSLKIAPGLTSDGHLRIAKATVNSSGLDPTRFAVAACLFPQTTYTKRTGNNTVVGPAAGGYAGGVMPLSLMPWDPTLPEPRPTVPCGTATDPLITGAALAPATVSSLAPAAPANGYTVTNDGSRVSVAADLSVQNVSVDVLIGDV
jgi:hypothetical protein